MITFAIVPKEHGSRPCRVVVTQDRAESITPYFLYGCVMESDRDIVRNMFPVVMAGSILFYLKLKKELEKASKLKLSSLNLQSKETVTFVM